MIRFVVAAMALIVSWGLHPPPTAIAPWVKIVDHKTKKPIGWVFREFVSCF